jgi:hypothetical protein
MNVFGITVSFLSLIVLESQAAAQVKSLCSLVTVEDARAFFGAAPDEKVEMPQVCSYRLKSQPVRLTVVNYTAGIEAKKLFELNKRGMESAKGTPKDEPGLGATAFSASTKSTIEIFLLKGNATVQLTASMEDEHVQIAATVLDKLRVVAKNAAGRM